MREAYERFVAPGFRHHNPYFRGDAGSLRAGMEMKREITPVAGESVQKLVVQIYATPPEVVKRAAAAVK